MRRSTSGIAFVGVLLFPSFLSAQATYELFYPFEKGATNPVGRLAEAPDGSLYGMTYQGGRFHGGAVFAMRPSADGTWSTEIVHEFQLDEEGGNPWGSPIVGSDGNLYGPTGQSGPASGGTIFRMTPSGELSVLHAFSSNANAPKMPVWRLLEASDGNFYGSTCSAAESTIFRLTPEGVFSPLHTLQLDQGVCPVTELKEGTDGFLYGQATYAGPFNPVVNGGGTLFRIGRSFAVLHAFRGPDGAQPVGGLVAGPGGALYGSACQGGASGKGVIFRIDRRGIVRTVHEFRGEEGAYPYGSLVRAADGALYGTALAGGTGSGTLFKIEAGGRFSSLHAFTGADGEAPIELMQARDGLLYGVTYQGGFDAGGTTFRLRPDGAVETLHAFSPGLSGADDGVIEGRDGTFYGTTDRTVFKVSRNRELTILHRFEGPVDPSGLIQATDGLLYGTTKTGGAHGLGTVFRIGTTGGHTVLHSFTDDSQRNPEHGVIEASDGNLYGTTRGGDGSTVFRMDRSGNVTRLHTFEPAWSRPNGPLLEGPDGDLYGSITEGSSGNGFLYRITKGGEYALVHSFSGTDGSAPIGRLVLAADGRLYGVTRFGGRAGTGTIFRLEATGSLSTLYSFARSEGLSIGLLEGSEGGVFYGVGDVEPIQRFFGHKFFRFAGEGLTILYSAGLGDAGGGGPSPLIQGSDGALYGTMSFGATTGGGVFRLTPR